MSAEPLIPVHGGYRKLKSFKVAQLAYDVTVRFCDLFIDRRSRTHDQMVQAARSGVQNIAEGSQAAGTSRKTELKLTNVARASLEELRLDYEDFLRQRGLALFPPDYPALMRFKARRCATLPSWALGAGLRAVKLLHRLQGREGGLDPAHLAALQSAETYFDPAPAREALGFGSGGLDEALAETVQACL